MTDRDPDSVNYQEYLLQLKTELPFRQDDKGGKWHFISSSAPDAAVTAELFCQRQIQMLVTGKSRAYLVSWPHKAAKIFKIAVHLQWPQAALLLFCDIQQQYLGQGQTPPEAICCMLQCAEQALCVLTDLLAIATTTVFCHKTHRYPR